MEGSNNERERISEILSQINDACLQGRPHNLTTFFHDRMVMVLPGFGDRAEGKAAVLAGFEDFCENARVQHLVESDRQIDVLDHVAVGSFAFDITYERAGKKYRSTGRDLWVFEKERNEWLAVWRTMLDARDEPLD